METKMGVLLKVFLLVFLVEGILCAENLKNYKAYDVTPNADQVDELLDWRNEEGVDFWRAGAAGTMSRVMIPPYLQGSFERFLEEKKVAYEVKIEDVGEVEKEFEADRVRRLKAKRERSAIANFANPNFEVYWTTAEIDIYCQHLADTYPQLVTRESIATSYEGRDVFALKISRGGFGGKPIIFIDGGMHAREWVSQATVVYLIHQLIEDPVASAELLDGVDWIIIPNLNPDGYHWSFTQERLWRQNRHRINSTCIGVDLNRNWEYMWRPPFANTCGSLVYGGEAPLSEAEVLGEHNYIGRYSSDVKMYMTVHSFGDLVLFPWGYFGSPGWVSNYGVHQEAGNLWADAIRQATGKNIIVGNSADIMGTIYGASDDHMRGAHNVDIVYTLELTGGGSTGFDYPESQIGNLNRETFHGYRALGLFVQRTYSN